MARNLFWLAVSFAVIVCGTGIRAEANVISVSSGISQIGNSAGGQTGESGGNRSCQKQSRIGATGRNGHSIPKPKEDRRSKGKGWRNKRKGKKKRKSKKKGCKKKPNKKYRKRKMKSLSISEREKILK